MKKTWTITYCTDSQSDNDEIIVDAVSVYKVDLSTVVVDGISLTFNHGRVISVEKGEHLS
jgi:hypothetical protein